VTPITRECGEVYYQTPVTKLQRNSPGVSESSPDFLLHTLDTQLQTSTAAGL